jgi:hypothetical protein
LARAVEELTGIERNGSATLKVNEYDTEVKLEKSTDTMKPGLTYRVIVSLSENGTSILGCFQLSVKQPDGAPLTTSMPRKVQLREDYTFPYNATSEKQEQKSNVQVITLDASGETVVEIKPPKGVQSVRLEAMYDRTGNGRPFKSWNLQYS